MDRQTLVLALALAGMATMFGANGCEGGETPEPMPAAGPVGAGPGAGPSPVLLDAGRPGFTSSSSLSWTPFAGSGGASSSTGVFAVVGVTSSSSTGVLAVVSSSASSTGAFGGLVSSVGAGP